MKHFQILAVAGLSILTFCAAAADDLEKKNPTGRKNARLDTQDAKSALSQRVQQRRVKQTKPILVYAERTPRIKLPWEPNAPGD